MLLAVVGRLRRASPTGPWAHSHQCGVPWTAPLGKRTHQCELQSIFERWEYSTLKTPTTRGNRGAWLGKDPSSQGRQAHSCDTAEGSRGCLSPRTRQQVVDRQPLGTGFEDGGCRRPGIRMSCARETASPRFTLSPHRTCLHTCRPVSMPTRCKGAQPNHSPFQASGLGQHTDPLGPVFPCSHWG